MTASNNTCDKGLALLRDPLRNKSTAFTDAERREYGLTAYLPARVETLDDQVNRVLQQFERFDDPLNRHAFLRSLQESNTTLFYAFTLRNLKAVLPVIYTPTVGQACLDFSSMFTSQHGGVFIRRSSKGRIAEVLAGIKTDAVDVVVITDGSRILGLGDLGANGMGIPIGKCSLYVAGAGLDPRRVLPVTLDVGTNTAEIRDHPLYLGIPEERCGDDEFYAILDEFMAAFAARFPEAVIQFEDFSNNHCFDMLERYQDKYCCFNDDIQGTGAVIAAGLLNAIRLAGTEAAKQSIVVYGAGSAAVGVVDAIGRLLKERHGIAAEDFNKQVYLVDTKGLVTATRCKDQGVGALAAHKRAYARTDLSHEESAKLDTLESVVAHVVPSILIGLAGQGPAFTEEIVKTLCAKHERPIILPLSNPTSKAEVTAEDAFKWSKGKAIIASGSPFDPVVVDGKTCIASQGNNMYVFPGVGLGAKAARASRVTEKMISAGAGALADMGAKRQDLEQGLYPPLEEIREISAVVAAAVASMAVDEGVARAEGMPKSDDRDAMIAFVKRVMWDAEYTKPAHQ